MPRAPRVKQTGFYHVISRGIEKRVVFYEEEDFDINRGQALLYQ